MIQTSFGYLTLLFFITSTILYITAQSKAKLFNYLPAIVIIYFLVMVLSSLEVWIKTDEINSIYKAFKSNLLPAMIFLMLLQADIRNIFKLGKKVILTFFLASFSISLGFIITFTLLHTYFDANAWGTFGALSGSWMGGTGNMIAIQSALNIPDSAMGNILLIDSIDYAIWVMILLTLVPFANRFNQWSGASNVLLEQIDKTRGQEKESTALSFETLFLVLSLSLVISFLTQGIASYFPHSDFFSATTWTVLLATILGVLGSFTPLHNMKSSAVVGNLFLYIIVALIASRANFAELTQAPLYIVSGFMIIAIHATIMVLFAKLFKIDLFALGVASLANIGGVASAPILAGAYHKALIPIGVLMAMIGYIIGTFTGLGVTKVLKLIGG